MILMSGSSHMAAQILILLLWALVFRLSVVSTDDLEQLLVDGVRDTLLGVGLTIKEAAYDMRIDENQLRRQLNREPNQYLALVRLFRLPFRFWMAFGPLLMYLVAKKRWQEIDADVRVIASDIRKRA